MRTYDNHRLLHFSDVLDAITLFYIIKQEVRAEMEEGGVEYMSTDEDNEEDEDGEGDDSEAHGRDQSNDEPSDEGVGKDSSHSSKSSSSSSSSSEDGGERGSRISRTKNPKIIQGPLGETAKEESKEGRMSPGQRVDSQASKGNSTRKKKHEKRQKRNT